MQDMTDFNALNSLLTAASLEEEERYASEVAVLERKKRQQQNKNGLAGPTPAVTSASAIIAAGSHAAREGRLASTAQASKQSIALADSINDNIMGIKEEKDAEAIWDAAEVDSPHVASLKNNADSRKRPEYDLVYKQTVGSETVYFGMGDMDPSSNCCQDIVLKIMLPGQKFKDLELDVQRHSLVVTSPDYRLATYLPYPVYHENGSAQWIADSEILKLTLPIIEE